MTHILRNQHLTLHVDLPEENYQLSSFDWTGKTVRFEYEGVKMTGRELPDTSISEQGMGLYNEFGIDQPVGFEEVNEGDCFPKKRCGDITKRMAHL